MGFVAVDAFSVARDTGIEAFGDTLAVLGLFELGGIVFIGDEADLGENAGHVGADEDYKGSLFDAAIAEIGVALGKAAVE